MNNKYSIEDCINILECAIGEVDYMIPSEVLEQVIVYLNRCDELEVERSWTLFPEPFH